MKESADFYRIEGAVFWAVWLVVGIAGATGRIETTGWAWAFWISMFVAALFTSAQGVEREGKG